MKQWEVAERIGVGRSAYGMYESGDRDIPFDKRKKLAEVFGLTLKQLENEDLSDLVAGQPLPNTIDPSIKPEDYRQALESMERTQLVDYCMELKLETLRQQKELLQLYRQRDALQEAVKPFMKKDSKK